MTGIESDTAYEPALPTPSPYLGVDLPGHNAVHGYVAKHPAVSDLLMQPGIVLAEVLAVNIAASSIFSYLAPNTFILLSVERVFSLLVNLGLAGGFLLLFMVSRRAGKHAVQFKQAAGAGLAMALLTGPVLYISLGNHALGPIVLLVIALYAGTWGLRKVYGRRESPLLNASSDTLYPPLLGEEL